VDSNGALALKKVPKRMLIMGGGMLSTQAGGMIGEIALAIEMDADAVAIGRTIHPHPTRRLLMATARMCRQRRSKPN
jgi:pyruvate/2-oxoglutarate dehydrogenase complex dihydrolipoamide dehydrogenase (E3) component